MATRALHPFVPPRSSLREPAVAILVGGVGLAVAAAAAYKYGTIGLVGVLAVSVALVLLGRPRLMVGGTVLLAALCEGEGFGIFTFTAKLYSRVYRDIAGLDVLVALAIAAVAIDLMVKRRRLTVPKPLVVPLGILLLAMATGAIEGHAAGGSFRFVFFSENVLAYLLLLPVAVANLNLDRPQVNWLLGAVIAVATLKAVLGLAELASGHGQTIEGTSRLTYYEPAANWLVMVALLTIVAGVVAGARPPRWMLWCAPLLLASLVLSYRRSFWIALVLGLLLAGLLASSTSRRVMIPAVILLAASIWLAGSIHFQSQLPLVKRVTSLTPSKIQNNNQDNYRLGERANVLAEIERHPITGIGVTIPWRASTHSLSLEQGGGRQYVHFAALWFWLKLGILGLVAYISVMIGGAVLAWQAWRRSHEPLLRAFGLASLCGVAGLVVVDTTAGFTGIDARLTVLFAAQIGFLAQIVRTARRSPDVGDAQSSIA